MTTASPLVTVLLPVRNGAATIGAAIESVLAQTLTDFELLVVDDGSTDTTLETVRRYSDPRLRVVAAEGKGLAVALNRGLAEARGALVARHDADDVSLPQRLERQVTFLHQHPEVVLVGSNYYARFPGRKPHATYRLPSEPAAIRWRLLFTNPLGHGTVMFRRDAVLEVGGYDPNFPVSQDYDLWSRLARRYSLANLTGPLLIWTHSQNSVSFSRRDQQLAFSLQISLRNMRALLSPADRVASNATDRHAKTDGQPCAADRTSHSSPFVDLEALHLFGSHQLDRLAPARFEHALRNHARLAQDYLAPLAPADRPVVAREVLADLRTAARHCAATRQLGLLSAVLSLAASGPFGSPVPPRWAPDLLAHLVLGQRGLDTAVRTLRAFRSRRFPD